MKTLDTFSKRLLIIAVSISMVLLSASVFMFTMQRAIAAAPPQQQVIYKPEMVGLGIEEGVAYYMFYDYNAKRYNKNSVPIK